MKLKQIYKIKTQKQKKKHQRKLFLIQHKEKICLYCFKVLIKSDIIKILEYEKIEMKKLVYLYIINQAKKRPVDAIMCINSFLKDIKRGSPLIKALAIRTVGYLGVQQLNEYLIEPIIKSINDEDPYVRKTAVFTLVKLFQASSSLCDQQNIHSLLQNRLEIEGNSYVISNLAQAIYEISHIKQQNFIKINGKTLRKLLIASNESIGNFQFKEWGQVYILNFLMHYSPKNDEETIIIDMVTPRLQHINPSVVLFSIQLILKLMAHIKDELKIKINSKLKHALINLCTYKQPEIQYTILKNIPYLIEENANLIQDNIEAFFIQYNDVGFIKYEKLFILKKLTDKNNFEKIINELKQYVYDTDPNFSQVNLSLIPSCLQPVFYLIRCVTLYLNLVKSQKQNYNGVIDEIAQQLQYIQRKYPSQELIYKHINYFMEGLKIVNQPHGIQSYLWLLSQFIQGISKIDNMIQPFIESYLTYPDQVKLQILNTVVKIFLNQPENVDKQICHILQLTTKCCQNPDIRDRAYIYWRILSINPEKLKNSLGSEQSHDEFTLQLQQNKIDKKRNVKFMSNLGNLSTMLDKTPQELNNDHFEFNIQRLQEEENPQPDNQFQQFQEQLNNKQQKTSLNDAFDDLFDYQEKKPQKNEKQNQKIENIQNQQINILDLI